MTISTRKGPMCVACYIKDQEAEQAFKFAQQVSDEERIQPWPKLVSNQSDSCSRFIMSLMVMSLRREDQPTRAETLRKEIAMMEEVKVKNKLIGKQETLIQGWREELKYQLEKHNDPYTFGSGRG